jgi:uncharacterized protein (DUF1501 family)
MFINKTHELSRRAFMRRSSQMAAVGAASSYAMGLAGIGELAAFNAGDDYKALVCIFLYGGNDHANLLIPFDASNYAAYSTIRGGNGEAGGGVALPRAALANTVLDQPQSQVLTNDIQYALAPTMPRMKARFDEGAMAPLLNVGPLEAPTSRAQYDARSVPLPPKLFSHNDQQSTWMSSQPEGSTTGWGGRMGDLAMSANSNAIFTNISATGNAVFLAGQNSLSYQISSNGAVAVDPVRNGLYRSRVAGDAMRSLLTQSSGHLLEADHTNVTRRSIEAEQFVTDALSPVALNTSFVPDEGSNSLANQLRIVAEMIAARNALGVRRQVFFVATGGYDNHDGLIGQHGALLSNLDFAMDAFYQATVELGVENSVTTFTASDFGRTLASNGDGSDHGWGAHHLIMGGAVNGGRFYGTAPALSLETDDQVGRGRLLPSTSVDEYSATLAQWLGVELSELPSISPNIGRFNSADLGFLQTG